MRRVAIIGANGQLGRDCVREFAAAGYDVVALDHSQIDIANAGTVETVLADVAPEFVVNTAAMHNVEACEANPIEAFRVNGVGSRNLAVSARRLDFRLVHISTDYVFDGSTDEPYSEDDLPAPLNAYGNSKLSGEHFILAEGSGSAIVRTSGLYGAWPCRAKQGGLNFVQRMLELARERGTVRVVMDEFVTPTYTLDLARQLVEIVREPMQGIIHATCQGECSWFEFAEAIFEITNVPVRLERATSADFPTKLRRPAYSVLDNARLRSAGIDRMPPWRDALAAYLADSGGVIQSPAARSV